MTERVPTPEEIALEALEEVVEFLLGSGTLEGVHFGDETPSHRRVGRFKTSYWWRSDLRKAFARIKASQQAGEGDQAGGMSRDLCSGEYSQSPAPLPAEAPSEREESRAFGAMVEAFEEVDARITIVREALECEDPHALLARLAPQTAEPEPTEKLIDDPFENTVHHPYSAHNQGWGAREAGLPESANPYDEGTREHRFWRFGWTEAEPETGEDAEKPDFWQSMEEYPDGPEGDYYMLRDAVIQFFDEFLIDDDVAEVSIMMDGVRDAGMELTRLRASAPAQSEPQYDGLIVRVEAVGCAEIVARWAEERGCVVRHRADAIKMLSLDVPWDTRYEVATWLIGLSQVRDVETNVTHSLFRASAPDAPEEVDRG